MIETTWIIAGMMNLKTFRNLTVKVFVDYSMNRPVAVTLINVMFPLSTRIGHI